MKTVALELRCGYVYRCFDLGKTLIFSDMLEGMTIDTQSESLCQGMNSSSNLQMSKAGMKLMTPEKISNDRIVAENKI